MRNLLLLIFVVLTNMCLSQTTIIKKCNNGDNDFDMYISEYSNDLVITVETNTDTKMGEIAVYDTLKNVLYTKTSTEVRFRLTKTILNSNNVIFVTYRSRHYVIRKKYTIE